MDLICENMKIKKINFLFFLIPGLILLLLFVIVPILYSFYISLNEFEQGSFIFSGFSNYIKLLTNKVFWISIGNTFYYTVGVMVPSLAISLLIAIGLNRKSWGCTILRTIYFLPVAVSEAVAAAIWVSVLNPEVGMANYFLEILHLPKIGWYTDYNWVMPTLIMVTLWKNVGYYMIIFLAGLQTIPPYYKEAAKIDGANNWHIFKNITLPLLKPSLFFVYITSILFSFKVFTWIYVMTQGGPGYSSMVTVFYVYREGFKKFQFGYASATSVVLFLILLVFIIIQLKYFKMFETKDNR